MNTATSDSIAGCSFSGRLHRGAEVAMSGKKFVPPAHGQFGERLVSLRKRAGLSQVKLAELSKISRRMIAYYEGREALPPGHVLSALAEALGVTVDEMMGVRAAPPTAPRKRARISPHVLRRVRAIEDLPARDKRELLSLIDTYIERAKLASARASS
jgi:transcriptional regulator with XRE-family HTH domain